MLTVKTKQLQKDLSRVIKGCTFGTVPISSMIGIRVKDNKLFLVATDKLNYIQTSSDLEGKNKDFDVSIPADRFYKLIQKMTTENIILTLKENHLEVKGDGKGKSIHKIEIPLDGDDLMKSVSIPDIEKDDITEQGQIEQSVLKSILSSTKLSVPKNNDINSNGYYYGGYYCGNNVVTYNGQTAAIYETKLFKTPYLFCKEAMDLIDTMDSDIIMYKRNNDAMLLISDSVMVYTLELDKKSAYPVDVINEYFENIDDNSVCKLSKSELNQAVDRVSLFISATEKDNKPLKLSFDKKCLNISNKNDSSSEDVEYISIDNFTPYTCLINFENLKSIVAAQSDNITMYFGDENALKFVGDKTKHLSSLILDGYVSEASEEVEEENQESEFLNEEDIPFGD